MAYHTITFPTTGRGPAGPAAPAAPSGFDVVDVGSLLGRQEQLNRTAAPAADKHITFSALDSIIPIPYGRVRVPAMLANAVTWNNYWFFWCLWGAGPVQAIEVIYINDVPYPTPPLTISVAQSHLGTYTQTVDPVLGLPLTVWYQTRTGDLTTFFNEAAPGIAYTTLTAPIANVEQPPTINAILQGRKLYDPRDGAQSLNDDSTWLYSRNPSLILADFLTSQRYGASEVVDWTSVAVSADANDAYGRTADFLVDKQTKVSDWIATMQTAANCWLARGDNGWVFKPDELTASVATFSHAAGNILKVRDEAFENRGNQPTVMEVIYTDKTTPQWSDASAPVPLVMLPGVDTFAVPWRKSTVRMPWIDNKLLAGKEAFLRFNKLRLRDPKFVLEVMDEGLPLQVGDAITVTYPDSGYDAIPAKITAIKPTPAGYALAVFFDDPNAYGDTEVKEPTFFTIGNPFEVPPVTNLVAWSLGGVVTTDTYTFDQGGIFTGGYQANKNVEDPDPNNFPAWYQNNAGLLQLNTGLAAGTDIDVIAGADALLLKYPAYFEGVGGLKVFNDASTQFIAGFIDYVSNASPLAKLRFSNIDPGDPLATLSTTFTAPWFQLFDDSDGKVSVELAIQFNQVVGGGGQAFGYLSIIVQNDSASTLTGVANGGADIHIVLPSNAANPDAPGTGEWDISFNSDSPPTTFTAGTPYCAITDAGGATLSVSGTRHELQFSITTASIAPGGLAHFLFPLVITAGADVPSVGAQGYFIPAVLSTITTTPAESVRVFTDDGSGLIQT
jgi:hypothetical protein